MHARRLVREYCASTANYPGPEHLSYPEVETLSRDHHEIHAKRIRRYGGEVVGTVLFGAGITPCLAWLNAKRRMGLCRSRTQHTTK